MKISMGLLFLSLACLSTVSTRHHMAKHKHMSMGKHRKLMAVSRRLNDFSFAMQKELLEGSNGNVVFSPFSIFTAFSMLGLGAEGNTRKEISEALRWGKENFLSDLKAWYDEITNTKSDEVRLSIANKAWVSENMDMLESYQTLLKDTFKTVIGKEEFELKSKLALENINQWVSQRTNGKIEDLFPPGSINSMTKLVLANAIYFKGKWANQFDKKKTCYGAFHLKDESSDTHAQNKEDHDHDDHDDEEHDDDHSPKEDKEDHVKCKYGHTEAHSKDHAEVSYMFTEGTFPYYLDCHNGAHVIELPYVGKVLSMILAIPIKDVKRHCMMESRSNSQRPQLEQLMEQVDSKVLHLWMKKMHPRSKVNLFLPKFEVKQSFDLSAYLKKLGMKDMFVAGKADLSGINGDKELYVSKAVHESYLKVDEEGSEAAGATGLVVNTRRLVFPLDLHFDRPFLFHIVHKSCNAVVFSGRVVNPTA